MSDDNVKMSEERYEILQVRCHFGAQNGKLKDVVDELYDRATSLFMRGEDKIATYLRDVLIPKFEEDQKEISRKFDQAADRLDQIRRQENQ